MIARRGPVNSINNMRWGVIADDLTGACDAGVQFAQHGFRTVVWLDAADVDCEGIDVTIITTNSRRDSVEVAVEKTQRAYRALAQAGVRVIYKKIDSTMLGNPGPEIETVRREGGFPLALVTPAFPEMGRTVADGVLHVRESGAAVDLVERFREQGVEAVFRLAPERLGSVREPEGTVAVFDAGTRADLAAIARTACAMHPMPLLAGSAGLAAELAACLCGSPTHAGSTHSHGASRNAGRIVLIAGSTNPVTLRQMEHLKTQRSGQYPMLRISMEQPSSHAGDLSAILRDARGLMLTGGDTTLFVCKTLEVKGIRLEHEILPGIPWGRLIGGPADGMAVATKAGGFGETDALVRIADFLAANT